MVSMPRSEQDPLRISVDNPGGRAPIVRLSGELDFGTCEALSACLTKLVEEDTDVVVDLRDLRFMDSSGLPVLVHAQRRAEQQGHSITLRRPTAMVAKVLAITGTDQIFTIEK
jgi:anti-sigma B factor antagonist